MYRKPVSTFSAYPLPAEVQIFSVIKCPQPTRNAVERANGYLAFVQSCGRSLRAVALAGGRWSSSTVTSISWRSAIVVLFQSVMPASNMGGRLSWFQESHGQQCVWNTDHLEEFFVFSEVIEVFAGLVSATVWIHRNRASRSRFVKDVLSWLWRWAVSRNGEGSRAVAGPFAPETVLEMLKFGRGRDVAWLKGESRGLPGREMDSGGFFREENIIVLESRSISKTIDLKRKAEIPQGALPTCNKRTCVGRGGTEQQLGIPARKGHGRSHPRAYVWRAKSRVERSPLPPKSAPYDSRIPKAKLSKKVHQVNRWRSPL